MYLVNAKSFVEAKSEMLLIVFILILFKTGFEARQLQGGLITMSKAFKFIFITACIGVTICTLFEYILFNFIDIELIEYQRELEIKVFEASKHIFSESFSEVLDQRYLDIKNGNNASPGKTLLKLLTRLLAPAGLFSLFIALIIKRNKKIESPTSV